jgi:amino acid adenylation domain-containing protein
MAKDGGGNLLPNGVGESSNSLLFLSDELEVRVAEIWTDLLQLNYLDRHGSFFDLGGDSLLAVRLILRVRQVLGVEVSLSSLFAQPVFADFVHSLPRFGATALPLIVPIEGQERLALSFAQERLWFLAQFDQKQSRAYHIPFSLRLSEFLDEKALVKSLDRLVARHEVLRTTFIANDGEPLQRIIPGEESHFHLVQHDLRGQVNIETELERLALEEARAPFDLERGPLIRGRLIRTEEQEHTLLITMHHIVCDGWSIGVLLRELEALYWAYRHGTADPLPPLSVQYADYAAWQRRWLSGEVLQKQADYWKRTLAGAPALLELPADRPRPVEQDFAGAAVACQLDEELSNALKALSQRHGTTLFMTLLAGWALLLARLSGQHDVVIGTPSANRNRREIEELIGFFVNTLALRVDVSGSPTVGALLERVKALALNAQQHQDIPFEQVVQIIRPERSLAHSPLFQVMFTWQNTPQTTLELPGLKRVRAETSSHVTAKFDLSLSLREVNEKIEGTVEYATALFDRSTVERYVGHWRTLLQAMVADDGQRVDQLSLLSPAERDQILLEWNNRQAEYPADRCIHELFEEQVEKTPDAVAVVHEGFRLSYRELNVRANRLAHYLRELGVRPDDRVAICVERGLEMVVALLAVLKAGGAYVALDPDYPVARLTYMLKDSAPVALLTQGGRLREILHDLPTTVSEVDFTAPSLAWASCPATNIDPAQVGLSARHLAYVIYTSGSTGTPKGVMIEHASIVNLWIGLERSVFVGQSHEVAVALNAALAFDASVQSWVQLLSGRCLVIVPEEVRRDRNSFWQFLELHRIATFDCTPAALEMIVASGVLKTTTYRPVSILVGGDVIGDKLWRHLAELGSTVCFNVYGPTECTVDATIGVVERAQEENIGRPLANTRVYILDGHLQPVPIGVTGEIFIAGAGVARGYLNRPELTAERFLADPFSADEGARMYKTGDLGHWLGDGNIRLLGRNDFQVKIRGFRIELGEIEARLAEHPQVRQAVVLAREDTSGDKRLVAYCVAEKEGEEVAVEELRRHLSVHLPDYMVPAAYVFLPSLPLTPNGKLDRKDLPAPDALAYAVREYEPPEGRIETILAAIWADVLKLERVGRHHNFFELGGHSLLAVQVISRARQSLGIEVTLNSLFARPVLSDFVRGLANVRATAAPLIMPLEGQERLALSFAQQRLWFLAQFDPKQSRAYHIPLGLRLMGSLDRVALRRSLDRIVARHEALRTTFIAIDGEPVQCIAPERGSQFHLLEHDLRDDAEAAAELARLAAEDADAPFDLELGPLIRGRLICQAAEEYTLLITMHHIVCDGWSIGVFFRELSALYYAFRRGEADPLPPLAVQYADYAAWQRRYLAGEVLQEHADYWRVTLAGAPALLELPTDRLRPVQQDFAGAIATCSLDEELTKALKALSRRKGTTLFMTLLASWAVLLARLSGQPEVVIGTPSANRNRREIEELIGFFVNPLPLRVDVSGSPTVGELLERVKAVALEAQQHQDLPFEQVVQIMRPERRLSYTPLFQVMFGWQNTPGRDLELPGLELAPLPQVPHTTTRFDLSLSLIEARERIEGAVEYATALFDHSTVELYIGRWQTLLKAMVADDSQRIHHLPLLSDAERDQ